MPFLEYCANVRLLISAKRVVIIISSGRCCDPRWLMVAPFVIGAVGAAALTLCNFTCHEILDNGLDLTPYSKEYLDIMGTEQVHCPWAHATCEDVRDLMAGKEWRQLSRLVPGAHEILP